MSLRARALVAVGVVGLLVVVVLIVALPHIGDRGSDGYDGDYSSAASERCGVGYDDVEYVFTEDNADNSFMHFAISDPSSEYRSARVMISNLGDVVAVDCR